MCRRDVTRYCLVQKGYVLIADKITNPQEVMESISLALPLAKRTRPHNREPRAIDVQRESLATSAFANCLCRGAPSSWCDVRTEGCLERGGLSLPSDSPVL